MIKKGEDSIRYEWAKRLVGHQKWQPVCLSIKTSQVSVHCCSRSGCDSVIWLYCPGVPCLKSWDDSYPSFSPCWGNFIDFSIVVQAWCFQWSVKVLAVCTRFSSELQTVFLFPPGPWEAQGLILFIDSEYRAGMSAQRLCGLSVVFYNCICLCMLCLLWSDNSKTRRVKDSELHQYFCQIQWKKTVFVLSLLIVKWKKHFTVYMHVFNFPPGFCISSFIHPLLLHCLWRHTPLC